MCRSLSSALALFALIVVVLATRPFAEEARALSVCPISEFSANFAANSAAPNEDTAEIFVAAAARARHCTDEVRVLVRAYAEDQRLANARAQSIYAALVEELPAASVREAHLKGCVRSDDADHAVVTMFFLIPGLPDRSIDESCEGA